MHKYPPNPNKETVHVNNGDLLADNISNFKEYLMSVTNEQRNQIRKLIERRIKARKEALIESAPDRDTLALQAERSAGERYDGVIDRLEKAETAHASAEKYYEEVRKETAEFLKTVGSHYYIHTQTAVDARKAFKAHMLEELMKNSSVVGEDLRNLELLMASLDDLTILATTDAQLRRLVDQVNAELGIIQEYGNLLPAIP
jgi:hypothetical protein